MQLSAKVVYHSTVCFFFLSLFTTDTNAGQSHRLTNCIQNLRRYNLISLIFKHSLIFIHTFKNTSKVLRPIAHKCYISSFNLFHLVQTRVIVVSDLKTDTFSSFFPTTPRQKSNPHPREGLTNQIPHSPGTENRVKRPSFAREGEGVLKFRFDRRITCARPISENVV